MYIIRVLALGILLIRSNDSKWNICSSLDKRKTLVMDLASSRCGRIYTERGASVLLHDRWHANDGKISLLVKRMPFLHNLGITTFKRCRNYLQIA